MAVLFYLAWMLASNCVTLALVLALVAMNLSFTLWHECAHGNFSRYAPVNSLMGSLASLATLYPAYFARKAEHLTHHRHEGDPARDPVFPRIQTKLRYFPFRLFARAPKPKLTTGELLLDAAFYLIVVTLLVAAAEQARNLLWVFFLPRLGVFFLHAYYICYLPHAKPGGGFETHRLRATESASAFFLTMGQNLHGLHHRWPQIPWHRYRGELAAFREAK